MKLKSYPITSVDGDIECPGDKSISQRAIIIGSFLNSDITISNFLEAEDPLSTLQALNNIGADITMNNSNKKIAITGNIKDFINPVSYLDLGNSGTGLRLLLGFVGGLGLKATFIGDHSLSKRPMKRVIEPLNQMGIFCNSNNNCLPIEIYKTNPSKEFNYELPVASAQVKSALLLAGLTSNVETMIIEPIQTRDHTERMLNFFGIKIEENFQDKKKVIYLAKDQTIQPSDYNVAGDFSSAAFLIVAALIARDSNITIRNVGLNPSRIGLLDVLSEMNANIMILNKRTVCNEEIGDINIQSSQLSGIEIGGSMVPNIIDEIPILSVAALFAEGETVIRDANELRHKETDRLRALIDGFKKLDVHYEELGDGIVIGGDNAVIDSPNFINSFDDHRIAMSFLVAAIRSKNGLIVERCDNISTSFPEFIDVMKTLGLRLEKIK